MRLDAYNRLAGGLQELEVEREVQSQLSAEVKRLRSELKLAEERLKTQQDKVSSITSEVLSNQNTVNNRRLECIKHTRICTEMGLFIIGKEYKYSIILLIFFIIYYCYIHKIIILEYRLLEVNHHWKQSKKLQVV